MGVAVEGGWHRLFGLFVACAPVSSTKVIRLIQEISSKATDISIEELTELMNRDMTVTRKVMVSANKIAFNPLGGVPVQTASQAVHMMGLPIRLCHKTCRIHRAGEYTEARVLNLQGDRLERV